MASADVFDFNELSDDVRFVSTNQNFDELISKIEEQVKMALKLRENPELPQNDSIKIDNYLAFAMNSLYWIYLKIQGSRDNLTDVNAELSRTRETITRDKEIEARLAAPRLDMPVARRLIAHGLNMRIDDVTNEMTTKKATTKKDIKKEKATTKKDVKKENAITKKDIEEV